MGSLFGFLLSLDRGASHPAAASSHVSAIWNWHGGGHHYIHCRESVSKTEKEEKGFPKALKKRDLRGMEVSTAMSACRMIVYKTSL